MSTATCPTTVQTTPSAEDLNAYAAAYARDGYLDGGQVIDEATLAHLRQELDRVIDHQGRAGVPQPYRLLNMAGDGNVTWQIVNIWMASAAFAALIRNPRIGAIAARLMETNEVRLWHDQIQYKQAGNGGVTWWHQDWPYWRAITPGTEMITAWVALDDVDSDNGCMSMVAGSHRWGDRIDFLHSLKDPAGISDFDQRRMLDVIPGSFAGEAIRAVPRPVRAGHVHFHHSLTWHGSHANRSGRPRRALAIHLMSHRACYDPNTSHILKPVIPVAPGAKLEGPHFPVTWMTPGPADR